MACAACLWQPSRLRPDAWPPAPPQPGEPSHELYEKEREGLLASLKRRAQKLFSALNELEGVTCNEPQGALYCMPRIRLSKQAAQARHSHPPLGQAAQ